MRKRKNLTKDLHIRIDSETLKELIKVSEIKDLPLSYLLRKAIKEFLIKAKE